MPSFSERLKHAWNAFKSRDPTELESPTEFYQHGSTFKPDRIRFRYSVEKTLMASIVNRIAMDVAAIPIRHVRLDDRGNLSAIMETSLDYVFTTEANKDQTGRAFIQDVVMSMCDEGCVAIVPIDATLDPRLSGSYEINSMRVGKITQWYPDDVRVRLYNDTRGLYEEIVVPKKMTGVIENPLYAVMNEPNSTLQRLIRKLNLLDSIDEQAASAKLNMIIQLPYTIKSQARQEQAEKRRADIESQLVESKYGIAYTDATEKITQLNRSVENDMLVQIEYLTKLFFNQLGISEGVFYGTANDAEMENYYNRTIEPIISTITDECSRKFITKTGRSQGQDLMFFRDPFKLIPITEIAEITDKLTRNEVLTSNEIRAKIGFEPADDPKADELRNSNIADSKEEPNYEEYIDPSLEAYTNPNADPNLEQY